MIRIIATILLAIGAMPVHAQEPARPNLPTAGDGDDIIVSALRIPRAKLPTQVFWNYGSALGSRIGYDRARAFARCAAGIVKPELIRQIVDGRPNSAPMLYAQGRMVVGYRTCYPSAPSSYMGNDVADYGASMFDRGAIMDQALRDYVPDAALSPEQTGDIAVRERFRRVEVPRNALRLPADYDALQVATWLVRVEPVLATRLIRSAAGSELERGLAQAMLVQGRSCLGATKRVTIDPTSFRIYVVDAFYRWVVAVRNVPTLIPGG